MVFSVHQRERGREWLLERAQVDKQHCGDARQACRFSRRVSHKSGSGHTCRRRPAFQPYAITPITSLPMDQLHFKVEDTPESPLADRQAVPYVNGVRFTELLGAVRPREEQDEPYEQYPEGNIGMEPETAFLPSHHYLEPTHPESRVGGKTVLLRCSCGDWTCTQVIAEVRVEDSEVVWAQIERIPPSVGTRTPGAPRYFRPVPDLHFDRAGYEAALTGPKD